MALKAHRQGHDTTSFLQLLSSRQSNLCCPGFAEHRISSAQIRSGSLLTRDQRIFMLTASQKFPVPCRAYIYICFHFPYLTLRSMLRHGLHIPPSADIATHENKQGILCCSYCPFEFRIDFKSYGNSGTAMFVTRWMDLGSGRDVHDPKWRNRLVPEVDLDWQKAMYPGGSICAWRNRLVPGAELDGRKVAYPRGSICAAFEQTAHDEFRCDALLTGQKMGRLQRKGPWLWPSDDEIRLGEDVEPEYDVVNGRFVDLAGGDESSSLFSA
ncbi:hypothetical protein VE03_05144 [Pseudogymnoascus sp. 23342-1-I1]|nr:hypothetical protein VE03_05144 [Pseudogymnoascus sp. 23342-1-I1]